MGGGSFAVSRAQQSFPEPKWSDIKQANNIPRRARQYRELGVVVRPIRPENFCLILHTDSSLLNMYKELKSDLNCRIPTHGDLSKWQSQGIMMLNTSLTVRAHNANSHSKKGWEQFTDKAIEKLAKARKNIVFLLWGKNAQEKEKLIKRSGNEHLVLKSAHPSGLSAHRGFFGNKHFSQTNAYLKKNSIEPIDWQIESATYR